MRYLPESLYRLQVLLPRNSNLCTAWIPGIGLGLHDRQIYTLTQILSSFLRRDIEPKTLFYWVKNETSAFIRTKSLAFEYLSC